SQRPFTSRQALQPCVARDTAGAARELASLGRRIRLESARQAAAAWFTPYAPTQSSSLAVLARANVAELYRVVVIPEAGQDDPANATRFVVVKARDGWRW